MKLESFLITERRTEKLDQKEALKMLSTSHSVAAKGVVDRYKRIYRGIGNFETDFAIVRPSQYTRMSKNTLNAYTLLLDNLPEWKEYPKRSKSIIATTAYGRAADYAAGGPVYIVFPENGAKIGVCSTWDIWDSFDMPVSDMSEFNNQLRNLILVALDTNDVYAEEFKDWKGFLENLDFIDKNKTATYNNDPIAMAGIVRDLKLEEYFFKGKGKLINHLADLLDPVKNGFELKRVGEKLPEGKEVWTDADCVFVAYKHFMDNLIGKF